MPRDMPGRAVRLIRRCLYARYVMASGLALGVDLASFLLLLQMKAPVVPASVAGYFAGLGIHWLLSSRLVFVQQAAASSSKRTRQKALFIASALTGLAITAAMMDQATRWGMNPGLAKLIAVGVSFQATYLLRRTFVFS